MTIRQINALRTIAAAKRGAGKRGFPDFGAYRKLGLRTLESLFGRGLVKVISTRYGRGEKGVIVLTPAGETVLARLT